MKKQEEEEEKSVRPTMIELSEQKSEPKREIRNRSQQTH